MPVKYLSLHNEEEGRGSWAKDGKCKNLLGGRSDRGMWWPKEQIVDFLEFMPDMLEAQGMKNIELTPGETANWIELDRHGIANAIVNSDAATKNLGLITSHAFSTKFSKCLGCY